MSDEARLRGYVGVWWRAVEDFTHLLEQVPPELWSAPTDLPGWDVHACAAHTAHLESVLAGGPEETLGLEAPAHVRGILGLYTEQGVVARRDRTPGELITEIRESWTTRHTRLLETPPTDAAAKPEIIFGGVDWCGRCCCATARSTSGCTSRTYAARSAVPAGSTHRPPSTPSTTCSRAWRWCWRSEPARRPGRRWWSRWRAASRRRSASAPTARAPAARRTREPTVLLRLSREDFMVLAGGRRRSTA